MTLEVSLKIVLFLCVYSTYHWSLSQSVSNDEERKFYNTDSRKAFGAEEASTPSKVSSFLVWLDEELDRFCERVEKQVRWV
jgi:hypothetical protein